MRKQITRVLALTAVLATASAGPVVAQGHTGHHEADQERPAGMMHQMMGDCPMAAGHMMGMMAHGAMGTDALSEQAELLGLTEAQMAELGSLRARMVEAQAEMRDAMRAMHEVLTPEQRARMQETHRSETTGMMHGSEQMRGMMGEMGPGGAHGSMHGAMMRSGPMSCPMMRHGEDMGEGHRHPR